MTQEQQELELKEQMLWLKLKGLDLEREQVRIIWAESFNRLNDYKSKQQKEVQPINV